MSSSLNQLQWAQDRLVAQHASVSKGHGFGQAALLSKRVHFILRFGHVGVDTHFKLARHGGNRAHSVHRRQEVLDNFAKRVLWIDPSKLNVVVDKGVVDLHGHVALRSQ
jgi:hypothetical protein